MNRSTDSGTDIRLSRIYARALRRALLNICVYLRPAACPRDRGISLHRWIPRTSRGTSAIMTINATNFLGGSNNIFILPRKIICSLLLLLITTRGFALPEDSKEVLNLRADSADLNQETHQGTYTGDVQLDQGSTHLRAAEAITEGNAANKLVRAIAKGKKDVQAHYWALTAVDKPPLHAYADNIYYYPDRHLIELLGNAHVEQGENAFSAAKISYDTLHQHVITKSDGKMRTTIIIHPEKSHE